MISFTDDAEERCVRNHLQPADRIFASVNSSCITLWDLNIRCLRKSCLNVDYFTSCVSHNMKYFFISKQITAWRSLSNSDDSLGLVSEVFGLNWHLDINKSAIFVLNKQHLKVASSTFPTISKVYKSRPRDTMCACCVGGLIMYPPKKIELNIKCWLHYLKTKLIHTWRPSSRFLERHGVVRQERPPAPVFHHFLKARLAQQTAETNGVLNCREIIFDAGEKSR